MRDGSCAFQIMLARDARITLGHVIDKHERAPPSLWCTHEFSSFPHAFSIDIFSGNVHFQTRLDDD